MAEPPHPVMAIGKVRHVGDPVAVVIAETKQAAKDAAAKRAEAEAHYEEIRASAAAAATDFETKLKEYEDLGDYERSFRQLQQGAALRREHLRYDVATDVATVDWIIEAFADVPADPPPNACGDAPIFIVGLPRSGSTLVDRILGSHSQVYSAGAIIPPRARGPLRRPGLRGARA